MKGVDRILRRLLEGKWRWYLVITLTSGVLLAWVWPRVDDYFALRTEQGDLRRTLDAAHRSEGDLARLQRKTKMVDADLADWEGRAMQQEDRFVFRNRLVTLVRQHGCQLRRVNMPDVAIRTWQKTDNPLHQPKSRRGKKKDEENATRYELHLQVVQLAVTGEMSKVRDLLDEIYGGGRLVHTRRMAIKPANGGRTTVEIEMELVLFGLVDGQLKPKQAA